MKEGESVILQTHRLDLIAATFDLVCAELESPGHLGSLLSAQVDPGWPPGQYDRDAQEFFRDRLAAGGMTAVGWYGWYAVRRGGYDGPSFLVGAGGYFGPPDASGTVEIGFSVLPSRRGMGYASEMAGALVANAFADTRGRKGHRPRIAPERAVNQSAHEERSVPRLPGCGIGTRPL